jgi:hypothetical protein
MALPRFPGSPASCDLRTGSRASPAPDASYRPADGKMAIREIESCWAGMFRGAARHLAPTIAPITERARTDANGYSVEMERPGIATDSCSFVLVRDWVRRLKIPWGQPHAGSSPAPGTRKRLLDGHLARQPKRERSRRPACNAGCPAYQRGRGWRESQPC